MPQPTVQFWFEFASTYSHIAAHRIEDAAERAEVEIEWRPFLLGPIFRSQGWDNSPFNIYPAKGAYMWRDMERQCARFGIPFRRPSAFPRNGLAAARISVAGRGEPWLPSFVRGVYAANFARDSDIADPAVLAETLERAGCADPAAVMEAAGGVAVKDALRANNEEAVRRGIFGAPSFIAAGELFWGSDRIEEALAFAKANGSDGL